MRRLLLPLLVLLLLPVSARAQASADEAAVRAAVDRIFEGMARADSAMVRAEFAEGARFAMVRGADKRPRLRDRDAAGARRVARPRRPPIDH